MKLRVGWIRGDQLHKCPYASALVYYSQDDCDPSCMRVGPGERHLAWLCEQAGRDHFDPCCSTLQRVMKMNYFHRRNDGRPRDRPSGVVNVHMAQTSPSHWHYMSSFDMPGSFEQRMGRKHLCPDSVCMREKSWGSWVELSPGLNTNLEVASILFPSS